MARVSMGSLVPQHRTQFSVNPCSAALSAAVLPEAAGQTFQHGTDRPALCANASVRVPWAVVSSLGRAPGPVPPFANSAPQRIKRVDKSRLDSFCAAEDCVLVQR